MKNFVLFILLSFFIEGVFGDSVSVKEGDSVTLHTGLTEIQKDDVLEWRFGAGLDRIARVKKNNDPTTYDDVLDGRFRGRLKLDGQTGDLTITNITTEHDGSYKMSINTKTFRTFSVIGVSGVDEVKSVSVIVGDSVSLNSGTIIQRDDVIEWRFVALNSLIAENNKKTGNFSTSDVPDGRFRDRLHLDYWTGSLTIRNTRTDHTGVYEAGIRKSSSAHTIHKSYSVTVSGVMKSVSVMEGDSVTLNADLTEIQTDDVMQWMFGDSVLAEIIKAHKQFLTYDVPDGIFRDRLKLDHQTGSLTITHTRFTDSGVYELKISKSRFIINKRIHVTVTGEMKSVSVMEGDSVTLHTDLTEIQTTDLMQWMFGDTVLAEINKAHKQFSTSDGPDGRFRDRLKLDHQTGSLTITHTRFTDSGVYELKISKSRFIINKRIHVTVTDPGLSSGAVAGIVIAVLLVCGAAAAVTGVIYHRHKISELKARRDKWSIQSVMEGERLTLNPDDDDEVHKDDRLLWMFRSTTIAERESAADSFTEYIYFLDGMFKDRLKLNPQTGSLTIPITRTKDSGLYALLIISRSGNISKKRFRVSVFDQTDDIKTVSVSVKEGESVTLETDVDDIQKVEQIQWRFGLESPLAEITRGTKKISPFAAVIFQDRVKLDPQTGSLTIKKIRPTDAGVYMQRKNEEGKITTKLFSVSVSENKPEEKSGRINNPEEVPLTTVYG